MASRARSPRTKSDAIARRKPADAALEAVATVAHELRTPLASLMTTVSMLVSDFEELDRDQASALLRRLERSTIWLQGLIDNLVSAAALESGALRLRREVVSVQTCVDLVLPIVQPLLERKEQRVRVGTDAATTFLFVDVCRVGQVLTNLLVNASRYSVPGDVIDVEVSGANGWAELRVVDHGPGVASSERERIFERHVRGADAGGPGLGLGLSIVRALVELHGGTIGLDDTPHGGASFWVKLPSAEAYAVHQPNVPPAWVETHRAGLREPAVA